MENTQPADDALDVAAQWIVKLRSPSASARDHAEFSTWLNASDEHLNAFDEMLSTWETLGMGAELPASSWDPKAQNLGFKERWRQRISLWRPGPANQNYWTSGIISMSAAAMLVVAIMINSSPQIEPVTYMTSAGESLRIELADQSVVELNTRTHIEVVYSKQQRLIKLIDGEAYFEVEGNKSRPFVVDVGRGTVTAVGTAFNIKRGDQQDWVAVTEGLVRVKQKRDPTTPYPASKFVQADQHLTLSGTGLGPATQLNNQIHWLASNISFNDTPLNEALAELNRYLTEPVLFESEQLAQLRLSGTFSVDAPQATLEAIAASFDLQLTNNTLKLTAGDTTH